MIIAGAGIIGLSCAWRLARCKIPVTIFDAGTAGGEASWAGAGMLAPGGEMDEPSSLTQMALRSLSIYPKFVDELREESALDIDFRRCGAMELAMSDEEAAALDLRAHRQAAIGISSERAKYPGVDYARFFPDDATVDPRQVTAALRQACIRNAVTLIEGEPVLEILEQGSGVETARGVYKDDGVLIAAGAWSSDLASPFKQPATKPVRGHLVSYDVRPGLLDTILRHRATYLLQRTSGALVAGATTEYVGFDRTLDDNAIRDITTRASRLLPALAAIEPSARWVGFRPGIEGDTPRIGRVEGTRVWTAYGHYRNGILLAPDTAERITESVTQSHY
jgi:glycine oxidase